MPWRGCFAAAPSLPGHKAGPLLLAAGSLASSIGLSPLYSCLTIDLHVRNAAGVHQSFPWLPPAQA
jgi:hypothetical protein